MKRLLSVSLAIFIGLCMLVATERQAYAYIDPGSGGLIALQSLASIAAAGGYILRRRLGSLFGKESSSKSDVASSPKENNTVKAA